MKEQVVGLIKYALGLLTFVVVMGMTLGCTYTTMQGETDQVKGQVKTISKDADTVLWVYPDKVSIKVESDPADKDKAKD